MPQQIVFEQPLNEKCRTLLRLSHLFAQYDFYVPLDSPWHARSALGALIDIGALLARADIKSDLLKDLERQKSALRRIAHSPGVDTHRLDAILLDLEATQNALSTCKGQLGKHLRKSDFLSTVLQRSSIPGGCCDFDLPQLHLWLNQPHAERLAQFDAWRDQVAPVQIAVDLILKLIRHNTHAQPQIARAGFYQQSLPSGDPIQMVQVFLPTDSGLYAEISGGKHRFSVRFMQSSDWELPAQTELDVSFGLNVCIV